MPLNRPLTPLLSIKTPPVSTMDRTNSRSLIPSTQAVMRRTVTLSRDIHSRDILSRGSRRSRACIINSSRTVHRKVTTRTMVGGAGRRRVSARLWRRVWRVAAVWMFVFSSRKMKGSRRNWVCVHLRERRFLRNSPTNVSRLSMFL